MRHDVFVLCTPVAEGERFAIVRPDTMPFGPFVWSIPEDRSLGLARWLQTATFVTEDELRAQLAGMGLPSDDVEDQIERARRIHTGKETLIWERTTRVGYRNDRQQEVLRKTNLAGTLPDQRVYVLRCGDCGHEYGANGCEIHDRRCPRCQGGPDGLSISRAE
jgi:hypothetical protein